MQFIKQTLTFNLQMTLKHLFNKFPHIIAYEVINNSQLLFMYTVQSTDFYSKTNQQKVKIRKKSL